MATEDKSTPSLLSPQNQRGTDRLQNNQIEDTIKHLRNRGYKVTEEYSNTGQLSKVSGEHPQRKTWWDWLQLLIIPLLISFLGIGFAAVQQQTSFQIADANRAQDLKIADANRAQDLKIAEDTQEEATLKAYLDDMTALLLDKKLGSQAVADKVTSAEAAIIARAKTLTVLRRLTDPQRKATVVQFLYESNLIGYYDLTSNSLRRSIINLGGVDLNRADLRGAFLVGADLRGVDLHGADLRYANLSCASLSGDRKLCANLQDADLTGADLRGAHLSAANLVSAHLSGADLSGADLRCTNLSDGQKLCAFLSRADLRSTNLHGAFLVGAILLTANLHGADLSGANLSGAILLAADLRDAKGLAQQQLDQVYSCKNAGLSLGLTCHKQP